MATNRVGMKSYPRLHMWSTERDTSCVLGWSAQGCVNSQTIDVCMYAHGACMCALGFVYSFVRVFVCHQETKKATDTHTHTQTHTHTLCCFYFICKSFSLSPSLLGMFPFAS